MFIGIGVHVDYKFCPISFWLSSSQFWSLYNYVIIEWPEYIPSLDYMLNAWLCRLSVCELLNYVTGNSKVTFFSFRLLTFCLSLLIICTCSYVYALLTCCCLYYFNVIGMVCITIWWDPHRLKLYTWLVRLCLFDLTVIIVCIHYRLFIEIRHVIVYWWCEWCMRLIVWVPYQWVLEVKWNTVVVSRTKPIKGGQIY